MNGPPESPAHESVQKAKYINLFEFSLSFNSVPYQLPWFNVLLPAQIWFVSLVGYVMKMHSLISTIGIFNNCSISIRHNFKNKLLCSKLTYFNVLQDSCYMCFISRSPTPSSWKKNNEINSLMEFHENKHFVCLSHLFPQRYQRFHFPSVNKLA